MIDIYNVTIRITFCGSSCTPCDGSGRSAYSTGVNTTAIQSHIITKCNHRISCKTSLPDLDVSRYKKISVAIYYNCTNSSTTKNDSGTTVNVSSSTTTDAAGISDNITGTDTNTDTSPSKTKETTVGVSSSPATQADGTSSEDLDTAIQPSSLNVVSAVVPTVLVLVAITLVSLVIITRRMRRRTGDKTSIRSDFDKGVSRDGVSIEANLSVNVNGVQHSTIADDNGEYNTINLISLPVTHCPTYNHVNAPICNPRYNKNIVSPLVDSDYASCVDIDETVIVEDTYSHITNDTHRSNEIKSNQVLPVKVSRSYYDHIELAKSIDNNADEVATGDNTYSHIRTELVNGRSLVDVDHFGDDYSHIGHVVHDTDAENSTNLQRGIAEARSSKSNIVKTCGNGTERKTNIENNEYRDIHDSKEDTCWNGNVNELNGVDINPLYQVKEYDDTIESNHSYFTLEKI